MPSPLLVNAAELLRQPGTQKHIDVAVPLVDVDVDDDRVAGDAPGGGHDAFPIEHGRLDLTPMVREEVLLAIPDSPLCRPDCAGLCPTCGADLNAGPCGCEQPGGDDRWAVLDQLLQSAQDPLRPEPGDPVT